MKMLFLALILTFPPIVKKPLTFSTQIDKVAQKYQIERSEAFAIRPPYVPLRGKTNITVTVSWDYKPGRYWVVYKSTTLTNWPVGISSLFTNTLTESVGGQRQIFYKVYELPL